MKDKFRYLPKEERKTILLLCDDIRLPSGVGNMGKEIVLNTVHHFNWFNIGAGIKHPDQGKVIDISNDVKDLSGVEDADVKIFSNSGYGNQDLIRQAINQINPDALLIFTDPRYWIWLFEIEREIRSKIPIFYLNIWDDLPAPMYNRPYYESVDLLMCISKQTKLINELVLGEESKNKVIKYVPHGISDELFYPISNDSSNYSDFLEFKTKLFKNKDIEFVVFFNSRNIRRKSPGDVILAYKVFCDTIGKENAKKCALIMHTEITSDHGTNLKDIKEALCDPEYINIFFSTERLSTSHMNLLYNVADVTMLISSNEGWGLSLTESMMAGTMIIANTTGGMQDQMRFVDDKGNWFEPSADIPSNHKGTYPKCGSWVVPIFPSNSSLVGSPPTPYIFDDRAKIEDVATAIKLVWELDPEVRNRRGLAGREWVTSEESKMTAKAMGINVIEACDEAFDKFIPRSEFDLIKVDKGPDRVVKHAITGY